MHARAKVAVRGDLGGAPHLGHERREVQLLPRIPRVPPGDPRQPQAGHDEHGTNVRGHA